MAQPVSCEEHVLQIAAVASNGDPQITSILGQVYRRNKDQLKAISIGNSAIDDKPRLEILEGYSFEQGFLSPYFTTDKGKTVVEYGSSK